MHFRLRKLLGSMQKIQQKHCSTRWLSLKFVAVWLLEQWENLTEYFLKFLPKQKIFKGTIKETSRYKRIIEVIQSDLAQHYLAFCGFSSADFEKFLFEISVNNQWFICCIRQWRNFCFVWCKMLLLKSTFFRLMAQQNRAQS